jgi:hypothetical protein
MNRKARRRAILVLERRRLLRDAANGRVEGADPFRFSLGYGADGAAAGNRFRQLYSELQQPSDR